MPSGGWENYIASSYDSGNGESNNPYIIKTPEQLALLAYRVNNGNKYSQNYFKIDADIDLGAHYWTPIGHYVNDDAKCFAGMIDGNGHKIKNMFIDSTYGRPKNCETNTNDYIGFIGYMIGYSSGYGIKNIIFESPIIDTNHALNVGVVCGKCDYGTIQNIYVYDLIINAASSFYNHREYWDTYVEDYQPIYAGGIVGYVGGTQYVLIADCDIYNGTIDAYFNSNTGQSIFVGGIVGDAGFDIHIKNCNIKLDNLKVEERMTTGSICSGGLIGGIGYGVGSNTLTAQSYFENCTVYIEKSYTTDTKNAWTGGLFGQISTSNYPNWDKFTCQNCIVKSYNPITYNGSSLYSNNHDIFMGGGPTRNINTATKIYNNYFYNGTTVLTPKITPTIGIWESYDKLSKQPDKFNCYICNNTPSISNMTNEQYLVYSLGINWCWESNGPIYIGKGALLRNPNLRPYYMILFNDINHVIRNDSYPQFAYFYNTKDASLLNISSSNKEIEMDGYIFTDKRYNPDLNNMIFIHTFKNNGSIINIDQDYYMDNIIGGNKCPFEFINVDSTISEIEIGYYKNSNSVLKEIEEIKYKNSNSQLV